jgi:threonine dehydrogenase-like Zn-dependent dehydrogenase
MRAARLHGVRDLRIETLPVPEPSAGELLIRIEGCGVCPTDVRKYLSGLAADKYPLNPGHEWVGRVESHGPDVVGWDVGRRVYGDTYAGYAEYAILPAEPAPWSHGPLALPDDLPLERAIFVEPLADCLHAVGDQARLAPGQRAAVLGAGQMGLQLVIAAALAGARVVAVEPLAERRELALEFGAEEALGSLVGVEPGSIEVVIVSVGAAALVRNAIELAAPGGRVVLFAGFGEQPEAMLDLNRIHYDEITLIGSEWIGTPPNQRRERYADALDLLVSGAAPLERLVDARCGLDELSDAFAAVQERRHLKTLVLP